MKQKLEAYRGTLLTQAKRCEESAEDSARVPHVRTFWQLEAARLRQVARDVDLLIQDLGGEARGAA